MPAIVTAEELKQKIDNGEDFILVNALTKESFAKSRIPGSINIPKDEPERARTQIPDKYKYIITYCASSTCSASPQLAAKLEDMGYTNVAEFKGGLQGWMDAGYELEGTEP